MRSVVRPLYIFLFSFALLLFFSSLKAREDGLKLFDENNTVVRNPSICASDPACHHLSRNNTLEALSRPQIVGLPSSFTPGTKYDLELRIPQAAGVQVYGFQLAAVHSDGLTQAGVLERVTAGTSEKLHRDVQFLFHSPVPLRDNSVRFRWTAPVEPKGEVTFRVATNSANGDRTERNDNINTNQIKLPLAVAKNEKLFFAHFGDAEVGSVQLTSQITLTSLSETAATSATVEVRDDNGQLLTVGLADGSSIQGTKDIVIPAKGSVVLKTSGKGSPQQPILTGSVTVSSDIPLDGVILFGGTIGVAGVGSSKSVKKFVAPVEMDTAAGISTGIAIMNLETTGQTIQAELLDLAGTTVATGAIIDTPVAGRGHVARFLNEFKWTTTPNLSKFQGTVRITATGQIAATVLRLSTGEFATLPVAALQ